MKILKVAALLIVAILSLRVSDTAWAEDHTVKSVILIPFDWKDNITQRDIDRYKQGVLDGLHQVQGVYAANLNGKTFSVDQNISVVLDPRDSSYIDAHFADLETFSSVGGTYGVNVPYQAASDRLDFASMGNSVVVYWVIGSIDGTNYGGAFGRDRGMVAMRHWNLVATAEDGLSGNKKYALSTLAHELGHSFGLVYAGYAKAHSCSEYSPQECIDNAPRPLPLADEKMSVMGYDTPSYKFPDIHFNNSIFNPEIKKLYLSPFLNPQGDAAPEPADTTKDISKADKVEVFSIEPSLVTVGTEVTQPFEIRGKGFLNLTTINPVEIYQDDPSSPLGRKVLAEDYLRIDGLFDSKIKIRVNQAAVPLNSETAWKIRLTDRSNQKIEVPDQLIIRREGQTKRVVSVRATVTCGETRSPMPSAQVRLKEKGGLALDSLLTAADGQGFLAYTVVEPLANREFEVDAESISSLSATPEGPTTFTLPVGDSEYLFAAGFNYPQCPKLCNPAEALYICGQKDLAREVARSIPAATAETPTPLPTPEATQIIKTLVSNYPDFRAENIPDDSGSQTYEVKDGFGADGRLIWDLSTVGDLKSVYIREVYSDDTLKDYQYNITDGKVVTHNNWQIVGKLTKKAVKAVINGEGYDLDKTSDIQLRLSGNPNAGGRIPVNAQIIYSDGSSRYLGFNFDYQPPQQLTPTAAVTPSSSLPITEEPVMTSVPTTASQFTETPSTPDTPIPTETPDEPLASQSKQVVGITVNGTPTSVENFLSGLVINLPGDTSVAQRFDIPIVVQYSDGTNRFLAYTFYYQPQEFQPTPVPPSNCPVPYPQCSKTAGLEDYPAPASHTIRIAPVCDNGGNIVDYQKDDLGNLGQCGGESQSDTSSIQPTVSPEATALCPSPFPQCGGTVGLEDQDPTHTFMVTPLCNAESNIYDYQKIDLGDLGQCQ